MKASLFRPLFPLLLLMGLSHSVFSQEKEIDQLLAGDRDVIPSLVENKEKTLALLVAKRHPAETRKNDPQVPDPQIDHTALVAFLIACENPGENIIKTFRESYEVVFEQKPREFFEPWGETKSLWTFQFFSQQIMQIPDLQKPFAEWMVQNTSHREKILLLLTLRRLLEHNFETTFQAFNFEHQFSTDFDQLLLDDFRSQFTDPLIRQRLQRVYARETPPPAFTFDPERPLSPIQAFQMLNLKNRAALDKRFTEYLMEKMAPLSTDILRQLVVETPLQDDFIVVLAKKYPTLHPELKQILRQQMKTAETYPEWDKKFDIAVEELQMNFQMGDLDSEWLRILEEEQENNRILLIWKGASYRISPGILLSHLQEQPDAFQTFAKYPCDTFEYLLEVNDPKFEEEVLEVMQQVYSQENIPPYLIARIWSAVLNESENGNTELVDAKIAFLDCIPKAKYSSFLYHQLRKSGSQTLATRLAAFYQIHQDQVDPMLQAENLSPLGFKLVCLLSEIPDLSDSSRNLLKKAIPKALAMENLSKEDRYALYIAGLNLGQIHQPMFEAFLKDVIDRKFEFSSFPIWMLNTSHRPFLPQLERYIAQEEPQRVRLLCIGLMIDPEYPAWKPYIDEILNENKSRETVAILLQCLKTLDREPDLSQLPQERVKALFDFSDREIEQNQNVGVLLEQLQRPENNETALKQLKPQLKPLLYELLARSSVSDLLAHDPRSWDILGEELLELVVHDKQYASYAAYFLQFMDRIPEKILPRILELLGNPEMDREVRNNILWIVARMGHRGSDAYESIRDLQLSDERGLLHQSFALAAISPNQTEREANFEKLKRHYYEDPSYRRIPMIGLLEDFEQQRLTFFKEILDQAFTGKIQTGDFTIVREIIYQAEHFPDPENTFTLYKDLLTRLSDSEPVHDEFIYLTDAILEMLLSRYPDQIPAFQPLVEALPFKAKQTANYRTFQIKAAAVNEK